jgi:hypothetical protein
MRLWMSRWHGPGVSAQKMDDCQPKPPFGNRSRDGAGGSIVRSHPPSPVFDAHDVDFAMNAVPCLRAVPKRWPSLRREHASGLRA